MPLDQWDGLKPTHGDQIGILVTMHVPVSLDVMAWILAVKEVDPISIDAIENTVSNYVRNRQCGIGMLGPTLHSASNREQRALIRRNRTAIAALYGWEIDD